jgi:hypothetical protein
MTGRFVIRKGRPQRRRNNPAMPGRDARSLNRYANGVCGAWRWFGARVCGPAVERAWRDGGGRTGEMRRRMGTLKEYCRDFILGDFIVGDFILLDGVADRVY